MDVRVDPAAVGPQPKQGRNLGLLFLLVVLAGGMRLWVLCHTEVTARDGIAFISYAHQLEKDSWAKALHDNPQHPGYPLTVLAVSLPVRQVLGRTDCVTMQLSAQLASAL